MHKLGKRKASEVDFWRFWGPQGKPKMHKNWKNAFRKSIQKKEAKKEAMPTVRGEGRRPSRGQKECKIPAQEGFCLGFWQLIYTRHHSRRSAADSFRSRDPRRPLRLKVSKLLFHIIDQHKNIMLREREHKTLQMRSENPSGISSANLVFKWHASCAWKMIGGNLVNHCPLW